MLTLLELQVNPVGVGMFISTGRQVTGRDVLILYLSRLGGMGFKKRAYHLPINTKAKAE